MKPWEIQKAWSDQFMPEIKSILGMEFIGTASHDEDAEHNTDLMVFRMDAARIACRVRRNLYLARYSDEFTIRSGIKNQRKTELHKLLSGWGDYMLYAFADDSDKRLALWRIIDLKAFRYYVVSYMAKNAGVLPGTQQRNAGGNAFRAFSVKSLPKDCLYAEGGLCYA